MAATTVENEGTSRKANVLRSALTGALAAGVFYVICWLGAFCFAFRWARTEF